MICEYDPKHFQMVWPKGFNPCDLVKPADHDYMVPALAALMHIFSINRHDLDSLEQEVLLEVIGHGDPYKLQAAADIIYDAGYTSRPIWLFDKEGNDAPENAFIPKGPICVRPAPVFGRPGKLRVQRSRRKISRRG